MLEHSDESPKCADLAQWLCCRLVTASRLNHFIQKASIPNRSLTWHQTRLSCHCVGAPAVSLPLLALGFSINITSGSPRRLPPPPCLITVLTQQSAFILTPMNRPRWKNSWWNKQTAVWINHVKVLLRGLTITISPGFFCFFVRHDRNYESGVRERLATGRGKYKEGWFLMLVLQ